IREAERTTGSAGAIPARIRRKRNESTRRFGRQPAPEALNEEQERGRNYQRLPRSPRSPRSPPRPPPRPPRSPPRPPPPPPPPPRPPPPPERSVCGRA